LSRETAAFWLEVHEHLRRDAVGLETAGNDYVGGRSSPAQLAVIAAPRLHGLIAAMHGHHQIEDFHYFPAFRRAEPQLSAGFDRLESEHADLSRSVEAALAALRELRETTELPTEPAAAATQQLAAQRYVDAAAALCRELEGHLRDEEDLVVPLLERSGY
jgi:iron-sulfur cluster repair protein YtfE (RIC family)